MRLPLMPLPFHRRAAQAWAGPLSVVVALMALVLASGCGGDAPTSASGTSTQPPAPAPVPAAPVAAPAPTPAPTTPSAVVDPPPPQPPQPPAPGDNTGWTMPLLPTEQVELHGTLAGEPFWLRLHAATPAAAGQPAPPRTLDLLYTPPSSAALGGVVLSDHPQLLLDDRGRLLQWNLRVATNPGGLEYLSAEKPPYYLIQRGKVPVGAGTSDEITPSAAKATRNPAWDRRIAPLLLAVCWQAQQRGGAPTVDFWGNTMDVKSDQALIWQGDQAKLGRQAWRISADGAGKLLQIESVALTDPNAQPGAHVISKSEGVVLTIAGRRHGPTPSGPPQPAPAPPAAAVPAPAP